MGGLFANLNSDLRFATIRAARLTFQLDSCSNGLYCSGMSSEFSRSPVENNRLWFTLFRSWVITSRYRFALSRSIFSLASAFFLRSISSAINAMFDDWSGYSSRLAVTLTHVDRPSAVFNCISKSSTVFPLAASESI